MFHLYRNYPQNEGLASTTANAGEVGSVATHGLGNGSSVEIVVQKLCQTTSNHWNARQFTTHICTDHLSVKDASSWATTVVTTYTLHLLPTRQPRAKTTFPWPVLDLWMTMVLPRCTMTLSCSPTLTTICTLLHQKHNSYRNLEFIHDF